MLATTNFESGKVLAVNDLMHYCTWPSASCNSAGGQPDALLLSASCNSALGHQQNLGGNNSLISFIAGRLRMK